MLFPTDYGDEGRLYVGVEERSICGNLTFVVTRHPSVYLAQSQAAAVRPRDLHSSQSTFYKLV